MITYTGIVTHCGRCRETLHREYGSRAWLHTTASPWCPSDKQHGPKTRTAFPLPGLYDIEELP